MESNYISLIDQFAIEGVEGGGLSISGVFVTTSCYVFLIIMGIVFILGGSLLSVIAFVPQHKKEWTYELHKSNKTSVIGPLVIFFGVVLATVGGILAFINKKLRIGKRLIPRSSPYEPFSNTTSFSNMEGQIQHQSPERCFSIQQSSLTLESLNAETLEQESVLSVVEDSLSRSNDIACFPSSPSVSMTNMMVKRSLPTLLDIPEIYITQPSPIPSNLQKSVRKKRRRNSFRVRHKVDHDIGATSAQVPPTKIGPRRSSIHGSSLESHEQKPRSTSPHSLPLTISLYDSHIAAQGAEHTPDTGDIMDGREWVWGGPDKTGSPTVDTDSILVSIAKHRKENL